MIYDFVIEDNRAIVWKGAGPTWAAGPYEWPLPGFDKHQREFNAEERDQIERFGPSANGYNLLSCSHALRLEVAPVWLQRNSIRVECRNRTWVTVLSIVRRLSSAFRNPVQEIAVKADGDMYRRPPTPSQLRCVEETFRILGKEGPAVRLRLQAPVDGHFKFSAWNKVLPNAIEAFRRRYTVDEHGRGRVDVIWEGMCPPDDFDTDDDEWEMLRFEIQYVGSWRDIRGIDKPPRDVPPVERWLRIWLFEMRRRPTYPIEDF